MTHACPGPTCRYHIIRRDTGEPACVLHIAADGPMSDREIGDVFGVTGARVGQYADEALRRLKRRALLMGLRTLLDTDRFANRRAPVQPSEDEEPPKVRHAMGAKDRIATALAAGCVTPSQIATTAHMKPSDVSSALSTMLREGRVVRVTRGRWALPSTEVAS